MPPRRRRFTDCAILTTPLFVIVGDEADAVHPVDPPGEESQPEGDEGAELLAMGRRDAWGVMPSNMGDTGGSAKASDGRIGSEKNQRTRYNADVKKISASKPGKKK